MSGEDGALETSVVAPPFPMQLYALLGTPEGFENWSLEEGLLHLAESEADLRVELPGTDRLAGTLETVRIQLEGNAGGSRFPLIWDMGLALTRDAVQGWYVDELDALSLELQTIQGELDRLPIVMASQILMGEDGFPGFYSRVSEHLAPMSPNPYAHLGALMSPVLGAVQDLAARALVQNRRVALVRMGRAVKWLWGGSVE